MGGGECLALSPKTYALYKYLRCDNLTNLLLFIFLYIHIYLALSSFSSNLTYPYLCVAGRDREYEGDAPNAQDGTPTVAQGTEGAGPHGVHDHQIPVEFTGGREG